MAENGSGRSGLVQTCGPLAGPPAETPGFRSAPAGLTRIERAILDYLVGAAGGIVTRDELSHHLHRRPHERLGRAIDMHISHLRKKLAPAAGWAIRTIRGEGYQLVRTEVADGGRLGCGTPGFT